MEGSLDDFTLEELNIFSFPMRIDIMKDLRGSYRTAADCAARVRTSNATVNKAIEIGLDAGFLENELRGKKWFYKTTERFDIRYKQLREIICQE
jgi:hypothetical protein